MKILHVIVVVISAVAAGAQVATPPTAKDSIHDVYGKLLRTQGSRFTIETRTGKTVHVDATTAIREDNINLVRVGHAVVARGTYDAQGVLHAETILRWKDSPSLWPPDD
jgi:hypothetical protein